MVLPWGMENPSSSSLTVPSDAIFEDASESGLKGIVDLVWEGGSIALASGRDEGFYRAKKRILIYDNLSRIRVTAFPVEGDLKILRVSRR